MPQIKLEYTANISFLLPKEEFFKNLHKIISTEGNININNCKSRLIKLENYYIGNINKKTGFIHLELKFLEGRSEKIKIHLGQKLLAYLKESFLRADNEKSVQITVQIIDINKLFYFKYPEGSITQ